MHMYYYSCFLFFFSIYNIICRLLYKFVFCIILCSVFFFLFLFLYALWCPRHVVLWQGKLCCSGQTSVRTACSVPLKDFTIIITSAEGHSSRYSENLFLFFRNTVSANQCRMPGPRMKNGCKASYHSVAGPLYRECWRDE